MAYLSTGKERSPCKTTHPKGSMEIRCGYPIKRLAPGGVLVTWTAWGFPEPAGRPPLAGIPGRLVRLRSGWLEKVFLGGGGCSGVDASSALTADFARRTDHGARFEMRACMRAPNVAAHTKEVTTMLLDLRFAPPATTQ
jgi:hypothetical protein